MRTSEIRKQLIDFIRSYPVFFIALFIWVILFAFAFEILFTYATILSPIILVVLFALLLAHRVPIIKHIAAAAWAFPLAMMLVGIIYWAAWNMPPSSFVYRLGIDVRTPAGIVSNSSLIRVKDGRDSIVIMGRTRGVKVAGEAVFCDLGEGNNLVALLAFYDDPNGTLSLANLPWRAAGLNPTTGSRPENGRYEIPKRYRPILISIPDLSMPAGFTLLEPDNIDQHFGEGYSIESLWIEMTKESFSSSNIHEVIPWVRKSGPGHLFAGGPLKEIGIHSLYPPFVRKE